MNQRIQADLIRIMKERGLLRRPFLLHLFSNSGYVNWCYFQRYLKKDVPNSAYNIYYKLQATVIDSAPCNLDPKVFARGFLGALLPSITSHTHWFWTPVFEGFFRFWLSLPHNQAKFAEVNKFINTTILPCPQTYLYSSADTMIFANDIKRHIKKMEKKTGLPNQSLDFVTSNHVAHLRTHPTAYSKRIDAILERTETNWTGLLQVLADASFAPPNSSSYPGKRARRSISRKVKSSKRKL